MRNVVISRNVVVLQNDWELNKVLKTRAELFTPHETFCLLTFNLVSTSSRDFIFFNSQLMAYWVLIKDLKKKKYPSDNYN